MIKVTKVVQFKRYTSLLPYYDMLVRSGRCVDSVNMRSYYSKERDVLLLLVFGRSSDGTQVAKIKCPINPLPIIGEFRYTNMQAVIDLIKILGWEVNSKFETSGGSFHIMVNEIEKSKENLEEEKKRRSA